MQVDELPAEPTARCKVCGVAEVVTVCHHCAATLCADHAVNGATGSREFRRLDIGKQDDGDEPSHCADCTHRMVSTGDAMLIFTISLALGLLIFATSTSAVVGVIVLIILGLIAAALALVLHWQRREEILERCPVMPEVENERIVETYRYRSLLSGDGTWRHRTLAAEGVVRADLRFGPDDVMRIEKYSTSIDRPDDISLVDAGFVLLQLEEKGKAAVDGINVTDDGDRFGAERVVLDATRVPYLQSGEPSYRQTGAASDGQRPSSVHHWEKPFGVRLPERDRLPVQVFPTLAPGSDRRSLEFHIHWPDTGNPMDLVADRVINGIGERQPAYIEFLEFRLPIVGLGTPTPLDGDPIVTEETGPDGIAVQKVRWEQVDIGPKQKSKRLSVRFDHAIPPDIHVIGRLALRFDTSLAGIEDMIWFDAMGRSALISDEGGERLAGATTASVVDVAFDFSMASLPYEASFVDMERSVRVSNALLAKIRPDHRTAIEVAHRLTESGFSIFRITESTFTPSDRSAEENRVWELWGRYFENTAPLDFQIKIGGADLRRRLEGTAETYQVTTVTLAAQAGVDGPGTLAEFEAQLRTIEEQTELTLVRLAGQGGSAVLGSGDAEGGNGRKAGFDPDLLASLTPTTTGQVPTWSVSEQPRDYDVADYRQERRCSMCARGGDHEDYSLCHHCGRLVCLTRCSVTVRKDRAFVRGIDKLPTKASHCAGCAEQEHAVSFRLHRIAKSRAVARFRAVDD